MILTHFDGTIQEKGLGVRKTRLNGNLGGCCQGAQLLVCSPRFPCFVWHLYSHLNISSGLVEIAPHFITTKLSSPLELDGTWQNLFSSVTSGFFSPTFTKQQDVTSTGRRPSVGNGGEGASLGTVGDHQWPPWPSRGVPRRGRLWLMDGDDVRGTNGNQP